MTISASSTTGDVYTADIVSQLTAVDSSWSALTVPTDLTDWIDVYTDLTDASYLSVYLDIYGFDLTDFIADCTTSDYCDNYFFEYRYDGLAMVNFLSFTFDNNATPKTDKYDYYSTLVLCIEEDEQCVGWFFNQYYYYDTTAKNAYNQYTQRFYSGAYIGASFTTSSGIPANWNESPDSSYPEGVITKSSSVAQWINYGFDTTYWYSQSITEDDDAFVDDGFALRFMAIDLPRNTVGDTLTVWALADVNDSTADAVSNDVTLASAANLALTTACVFLTASLM